LALERVARDQHGRRGRRADPAWAHRRLLLAAGNRLSHRGLDRLTARLAADDPTNEIGAAWGVRELLRQLLACTDTHLARRALFAFYDAMIIADMSETTRLAQTIQTWWPEIAAFLRHAVGSAPSPRSVLRFPEADRHPVGSSPRMPALRNDRQPRSSARAATVGGDG